MIMVKVDDPEAPYYPFTAERGDKVRFYPGEGEVINATYEGPSRQEIERGASTAHTTVYVVRGLRDGQIRHARLVQRVDRH